MALCHEVKPLQIIPTHLVQPLRPNCPTHLAMSQVELVERLLKHLGTENSGFTVDNVMRVRTLGSYNLLQFVLRFEPDIGFSL